jgi:hypothetical protein
VFPVRYGLNFCILFRRNPVFKGLIAHIIRKAYSGRIITEEWIGKEEERSVH